MFNSCDKDHFKWNLDFNLYSSDNLPDFPCNSNVQHTGDIQITNQPYFKPGDLLNITIQGVGGQVDNLALYNCDTLIWSRSYEVFDSQGYSYTVENLPPSNCYNFRLNDLGTNYYTQRFTIVPY